MNSLKNSVKKIRLSEIIVEKTKKRSVAEGVRNAKMILIEISDVADEFGYCNKDKNWLCRVFEMSLKTVERALNLLEKYQFITRIEEPRKRGKFARKTFQINLKNKHIVAVSNVEEKTKTKSSKKGKTTNVHPAIRALHIVQGARFPPKPLWAQLIELIGDEPDIGYMMECAARWREQKGYLGDYTTWLYNWYLKRNLPVNSTDRAATAPPNNQRSKTDDTAHEPAADQETRQGNESRKSRIFGTRDFDTIDRGIRGGRT